MERWKDAAIGPIRAMTPLLNNSEKKREVSNEEATHSDRN
jgi:hypothetical protein